MEHDKLFIISGPSGAGEDSVIEGLKKSFKIERVITSTTRSMRSGEFDGNPYYFISKEEFEKGIKDGIFFEYAKEYNDNYYGVTKNEIQRVVSSGALGIWKIEYKGVITAKKLIPGIVAIFIMTENIDVLKNRLKKRGESENFIEERIGYTSEWLRHENIYDYKVVNYENKLDETVEKVKAIILKHLNK